MLRPHHVVHAARVNARYVVRITPADVGARVSVRSRIPAAGGGPSATDTLGVLEAWSGGALRILRKDGTTALLQEADLLAARRVPPPPPPRPVWIEGRPAAAQRRDHERDWRARVAASGLAPAREVRLDFVLTPGRWVDLDSVAEVAVAGLQDGGTLGPRLATLDALLATKREGEPTGVRLATAEPGTLAALPLPGPDALAVTADRLPVPGDRDAKRALRARLAEAWDGRALLDGAVWAEVAVATRGSLLAALEPALDTLEPVLGRDPRGQPRQEFFPNDDRIVWLRVLRAAAPHPPLRLTVGPVQLGCGASTGSNAPGR